MRHDIVVIGASAGGVEAIGQLLKDLPADLPASLFVVLHMSPTIPSHLPHIWNRTSSLKVVHPKNGDKIERGRVYVAPPDFHLVCEDGVVGLSKGPTENRYRPSADALFRSAAATFGPRVIGVILTGMLDDGAAGLWHVKHKGGIALVQSPDDAQYPGMPLNAIRIAPIDHILPLKQLGRVIDSHCRDEHEPSGEQKLDFSSGEVQS
jgi:two-component system chemotaxis response regulator CheB